MQNDWIDLTKVSIPQADEQQRLFVNLILEMNADRKPLPRFWYLPRGLKAAVVMTGDNHGNDGTTGRFDQFLAQSPENCSVADWECIRGTSYVYPSTPLTNEQATAYAAQGFEIGLHVDTQCADYTRLLPCVGLHLAAAGVRHQVHGHRQACDEQDPLRRVE